jgi:hypothetical protein
MLAVLAAALIAPASPLPSVAELIARHRHVLKRMRATTASWSGSIVRGDVVERFQVTADSTGRYRETWTTPLGETIEGSDGVSDWNKDENGNVESYPTKHAFSFQFALVRLNDFRIDDLSQTTVTGPVDVDGHAAYALKVTGASRTSTLFVDVDTALLDGVDSGDHVVRYRSYKYFDGTPIPTVIADSSGGTTSTRTIEHVTFSVPVAGLFAAPAPREPEFPDGTKEVSTSFDSPRGLIVLQATINDKPVRLLLDSGSSSSVLDLDVAKRLGLPSAGTAKVQGAGELFGTFARIERLEVARIAMKPFVVEAVPLKLPAVLDHERIDGVLGFDFLAHVVTRIAYFPREIRFTQPDAFSYTGTGTVLPLNVASRVPLVVASVGTGDKGTFTVDTGSDEGLVLYREFANAHPYDFTDPVGMSQQRSSGVGGEFTTKAGTITTFTLGSFAVAQVPAEVVLRPTGAFTSGESDGLIGARLLGAFGAVFLDYRGGRLILEK